MRAQPMPRSSRPDLILGWSALGAAALAVVAWAACCVLPLALGAAGISLAGTAFMAGQRTWLTGLTLGVLAAGWWLVGRRRRACASQALCAAPSRLTVGLLSAATILVAVALAWGRVIEPWALRLILGVRG